MGLSSVWMVMVPSYGLSGRGRVIDADTLASALSNTIGLDANVTPQRFSSQVTWFYPYGIQPSLSCHQK